MADVVAGGIQSCVQIKLSRLNTKSITTGLQIFVTGRIVLVSAGKVNTSATPPLPLRGGFGPHVNLVATFGEIASLCSQ
jgi:hypothetical protein